MATSVRIRNLDTTAVGAALAPTGPMCRSVLRLAAARAPVLLVGPPGRGKRWVAGALHAAAGGGLLRLVEPLSGLASPSAPCELEALLGNAGAGSILLPSLHELPPRWQATLADAMERCQARIIATLELDDVPREASSRLRRELVDRFLPLAVPPLRQRPEDIEYLAVAALAANASRAGQPLPPLSDIARARLRAHAWPGDCAELERFAERAVAMRSVELALHQLDGGELPPAAAWHSACERLSRGEAIELEAVCRRVVRHTERRWIERVAAVAVGDGRRLAALLGLTPAALSGKLRDLGLPELGT